MDNLQVSPHQRILTTISDLNREIFLELDDVSLSIISNTCKDADAVYKDDLFWREKIIREFDMDLAKYKDGGATYRDMYNFMIRCKNIDEHISFLIYCSIVDGYLPILRYLVEERAEREYTDARLIEEALESNQGNIIIYVIEKYLEPDTDKYIITLCLLCNNIDVYKYLIEKSIVCSDNVKKILMTLAYSNRTKIIRYIVETLEPNTEQLESVMFSAILSGRSSTIQYIADKGINLNKALRLLSVEGLLTDIKYLVEEKGADDLNNALVRSATHGQSHVVKYLISKGADNHYNNDEALHNAEAEGHHDIIEYLRRSE